MAKRQPTDALLQSLVEQARRQAEEESRQLEGPWQDLLDDRLPREERRRLEEEAMDSPEMRRALEAFTPLSQEFRSGAVEKILAGQREEAKESDDASTEDSDDYVPRAFAPVSTVPQQEPAGGGSPMGMDQRYWALAAMVLLAASLAVLLPRVDRQPWPAYQLAVSGMAQSDRSAVGERESDDETTYVFGPGNRFELLLRPEKAVSEPVEATLLRRQGEAWVEWPAPYDLSDQGVLRIAGRIGGNIPLPPGETLLFVAVAPTGTAVDPEDRSGKFGRLVRVKVLENGAEGGTSGDAATRHDVEFAGCREVMAGPVCVLGEERELSLWVRKALGDTVALEPAPRSAPVTVQGGERYELTVPPDTQEVRLEIISSEGFVRPWVLKIQSLDTDPSRLDHFKALLEAGGPEGALEWLKAGPADPAERGRAHRHLASYHYQRGEEDALDRVLDESTLAFGEAGLVASGAGVAGYRLHRCIQLRRFARCEGLAAEFPVLSGHGESLWRRFYYSGLLAKNTGDLRGARRHGQAARELAGRLGLPSQHRIAAFLEAQVSQLLGRYSEARSTIQCLLTEQEGAFDPCDRGRMLNQLAWNRLMEREAEAIGALPQPAPQAATCPLELATGASDDPQALLHEALDILATGCDKELEEPFNVRMNLVLADLQEGRQAVARSRWNQIQEEWRTPGADLVLWGQELEARLLLEEGDPATARDFSKQLGAFAQQAGWPEGEWRAAFGEARAASALGDEQAALEAFARAEEVLEEELLWLPMDQRLGTLATDRQRAARHHLELLVGAGRLEEALAVARRDRSRALRSLRRFADLDQLPPSERARWHAFVDRYLTVRGSVDKALEGSWELASDRLERLGRETARQQRHLREELDILLGDLGDAGGAGLGEVLELGPDEGLFTCHPMLEEWLCLLAYGGGIEARRVGSLAEVAASMGDAESASARLLAPFAESLGSIRRLRWLPIPPLDSLDLHALPFAGSVLLESVEVVYDLDLPVGAPDERLQALVVADPGGDLGGARAEAEAIERALRAGGEHGLVDVLSGEVATGSAVREALGESRHFHYAGHALFGGWNSHLPLAAGTGLWLDDVLALPLAPERVVLAGCETGRDSGSTGATLGLAQAFVVAGSRSVIAAVRPVDDAETRRLMDWLYRSLNNGSMPGEALRAAQLQLRAEDPQSGWAAFRLFEP